MAEVAVTVKTVDQGSAQMRAYGQRIDDLNGKVKGAQASWQKYAVAAGAVAGVLAGVGAAAAGAKKALGDGAALDLAARRFDNLTASIGTTADALTSQMAVATQGMMSQATMVDAASGIISLGLADTSDEVVRLSNLVGQLGWDMQVLTLTMANDSMLRLDALGLSMENVKEKMEALKAAGVSADEAFDLAVIEAGEEKLELLGSAADTTAGQIQALKADWEDAVNAFKLEFASSVTDQLGQIATTIDTMGPGFEAGMSKLGQLAGEAFGMSMQGASAVGLNILNSEQMNALGMNWVEQQQFRARALAGSEWETGLEMQNAVAKALREQYGLDLLLMGVLGDVTQVQRQTAIATEGAAAALNANGDAIRYNAEGAAYATEQYWALADSQGALYGSFEYGQFVLEQQAAAVQNLADRTAAYEAQLERLWQTRAEGGDFFMAQAGTEAADRIFNPNMTANADALNQLILGIADSAGVGAIGLADLNIQMGEMEPAAARAMVAATVAQSAIETLISAWQGGQIDTSELLGNIDAVIAELQNKELPAIELEIKTKLADPLADMAPGERRAAAAMGDPVEVPVEADMAPFETALATALGNITGAPSSARTLEILAEYEAVTDVLETKIPAAVAGMPADGRTITFISDDAAVRDSIAEFDQKHITIYVDYIPTGEPVPKAAGGPVAGGGAYWVGEVGPELFVPWTNGTIIPNHMTGGRGSGEVSVTMNFYGPTNGADVARAADKAGRRLMERIRQAGVAL